MSDRKKIKRFLEPIYFYDFDGKTIQEVVDDLLKIQSKQTTPVKIDISFCGDFDNDSQFFIDDFENDNEYQTRINREIELKKRKEKQDRIDYLKLKAKYE